MKDISFPLPTPGIALRTVGWLYNTEAFWFYANTIKEATGNEGGLRKNWWHIEHYGGGD